MTAIEIVTADGRVRARHARRTSPTCSGPSAAAAARFGVVTAIEFHLFPIEEVYAGVLWFPFERAAEVLNAWRDWIDDRRRTR